MPRIFLKQGRDLPARRGHPWIFSGAIDDVQGDTDRPGIADIHDSRKSWIARGLFNPRSQIRVRILTWKNVPIDGAFFLRRFRQALSLRTRFVSHHTNAYRLINGEGDFVPGLVIDRYGDFAVCQFLNAGIDTLKPLVVEALMEVTGLRGVFERSEGRVRSEEGLEPSIGTLAGEPPPDVIRIQEHGLSFIVDPRHGQKTGFFLDQRDNRRLLSGFAQDSIVLNCFSYSGAFSVYALSGGAREVVTLDTSKPALQLAEENFKINGFDGAAIELLKGDAFTYLKECDTDFDVIVLDPPSLAHRRNDVAAAVGGYKYLNLHALRHLPPGGVLLTFSCSQHVSAELFQKVVFGAAVDAKRTVSVLKRLGQAIDHPVSLHHPEGEYLKGLALHVLD